MISCRSDTRALTSLVHGGPRLPADHYRVHELGCAVGANSLPLAWYRRHGEFTGLDASGRQIDTANDCKARLGLTNVHFVSCNRNGRAAAQFIRFSGTWGDVKEVLEFVLRNELIELRCIGPGDFGVAAEP